MNGKELILAALSMRPVERTPWAPFVGSHGGKLIGVTADQYLKSADHIAAGLLAAKKRYRADGLPIVFDLQLEAEILGCQLKWSKDGPPSVASHPLAEGKTLADLPEFDLDAGRLPVVWDALAKVKKEIGHDTAIYGLICGPFTLALHLLGNDIFMEMFDHSDYVQAVIGLAAALGRKMAAAYLEKGADVIAITDPMVSQISPEHYDQFVRPHIDSISREAALRGEKSCIFVCGDATRNLESMALCLAEGCSIDENISLPLARDIMQKAGKSLGGNMRLTTVLLLGTPDAARVEAVRCLKEGAGPGFILAPGCDLPYATPPENLEAVGEVVHDPYKRQIAEKMSDAGLSPEVKALADAIVLPDYAARKEVFIDLVTLDSATCAPCQYMAKAAAKGAEEAGVPFKLAEHKVVKPEGIAMMVKLGVANIPTICLDGKATFISLIPDQATLAEAIRKVHREKAGK